MAKIGQPYTSGNWLVKEGKEEAFIARWTEFTEWSLANAPGAETFVLIGAASDPRRFISFGAWEDTASVTAWRDRPDACRALCDEFQPTDSSLVAAVGV